MKSIPDIIKNKREKLGLTQKELADSIGLGLSGERLIRDYENNEQRISEKTLNKILNFPEEPPFFQNPNSKYSFSFIDLFAGIGGIRLPFQELGGYCAFTSEWDKFAQKTYRINFGHSPAGDITKIHPNCIPDHDVLLGGFPCQAFSQAGLKKGFHDTRGTLFFEIQKILVYKRPKAFLLENVKQLRGHDKGKTLQTLLSVLRGASEIHSSKLSKLEMSEEAKEALGSKLNYWVDYKVLKANDFGVPQKRERIYIVGFDKDQFPDGFNFESYFEFPCASGEKTKVGSILENSRFVDEKYTISDKIWIGHQARKKMHQEKGNGFGFSLFSKDCPYTNTISARYYKDGSEVLISQDELKKNPRKLTPRECARLQGFPEEFLIPVSDSQAYKQFGNSVSVPVVRAVAKEIIKTLKKGGQISINKSIKYSEN